MKHLIYTLKTLNKLDYLFLLPLVLAIILLGVFVFIGLQTGVEHNILVYLVGGCVLFDIMHIKI